VGFKWFVDGLVSGSLGFAGEESAGASFLAMDGSAWSTDKDGLIAALLSAEITARSGQDPGEIYAGLCAKYGRPVYERIDAPAICRAAHTAGQIVAEGRRGFRTGGREDRVRVDQGAGRRECHRRDQGDGPERWFAARPSGTEDVYKIYAESFRDLDHLKRIQGEAKAMIAQVLQS